LQAVAKTAFYFFSFWQIFLTNDATLLSFEISSDSIIASPLYELMKKNVEFVWTRRCQDAFDELKRRLMTGPILALPKKE